MIAKKESPPLWVCVIFIFTIHILFKSITPRNQVFEVVEIPRKECSISGTSISMQAITKSDERPKPKMISLGTFELTAYCSCSACCGWNTGITASGTHVEEGRTIASNIIPIGTHVYIEGLGDRIVEDTGNMPDNVIDVYIGSHEKALEFGRQRAEVKEYTEN